jgi:hypothetical protein
LASAPAPVPILAAYFSLKSANTCLELSLVALNDEQNIQSHRISFGLQQFFLI